jgi:DNA-binding transcriptional ArsR family regulator
MMDVKAQRIMKLPEELASAIKGLDNENRRTLLFSLYYAPKMAFSEILKETRLGDSLLSSHLRTLQDSYLVEQFYEHEMGNEKYSFYALTKFGRNILTSLLSTYYIVEYEGPQEPTLEPQSLNVSSGLPQANNDKNREHP